MAGNTPFAFARPEWLDEVASTNDWLKERAAAAAVVPGAVVAARKQTRGRGRMNSRWEAAEDGDLLFSFYWSGKIEPLRAGTLPMACALGIIDMLSRPPWRLAAQCKWPNDVLIDGAKICGILTEGCRAADGEFGLVVGIGVNIRPAHGRDARLGRKTASLEDFTGPAGGIEALLPVALDFLRQRITAWQVGGFAAIREDFEKHLWGIGRGITVKTTQGGAAGRVVGLGPGGELLLRRENGDMVAVTSVSAIEAGWL